jgi:hypothetical protein
MLLLDSMLSCDEQLTLLRLYDTTNNYDTTHVIYEPLLLLDELGRIV